MYSALFYLTSSEFLTLGTVLGYSLGLITESSSTVQLVHFTLRGYLSNNSSPFQSPHSMIAEVCLTSLSQARSIRKQGFAKYMAENPCISQTHHSYFRILLAWDKYLSFQRVRQLLPSDIAPPFTFPLLCYTSCYWGKHIRREKTEGPALLALSLYIYPRSFSCYIAIRKCLGGSWGLDRESSLKGFTGFKGAAILGIAEVLITLLAIKEWDINAADINGRTALSWSAVGGYGCVVEILLRPKDVNPDAADTEYDRTPLRWAATGGHEEVLMLLLECEDIDHRADTEFGRAPRGGHERVAKLFLRRADMINPNTTDTFSDRTPLSWASENGDEEAVKLLLG